MAIFVPLVLMALLIMGAIIMLPLVLGLLATLIPVVLVLWIVLKLLELAT